MNKYHALIKAIIEIIVIVYVYLSIKNKELFVENLFRSMKYTFILFCCLIIILSISNSLILDKELTIINIGFLDFVFISVLAYLFDNYLKKKKK